MTGTIKGVLQLRVGTFGNTLRFRKGLNPLNDIGICSTDSFKDLVSKICEALPTKFKWDITKEAIRYQRIKEQPQSTLESIDETTDFYSLFQSIKDKRRYQEEEFCIQIWIFGKWASQEPKITEPTMRHNLLPPSKKDEDEIYNEMNREKKRRVEEYLCHSYSDTAVTSPADHQKFEGLFNHHYRPQPQIPFRENHADGQALNLGPSGRATEYNQQQACMAPSRGGLVGDCLLPEQTAHHPFKFDQMLYDHPPKHETRIPYKRFHHVQDANDRRMNNQDSDHHHHRQLQNQYQHLNYNQSNHQMQNHHHNNNQHNYNTNQNYFLDTNNEQQSYGLNDFTLKVLLNGAPVTLELHPESVADLRDLL